MLNPDFKAARFSTEACSLYDNWLRRGGGATQKFEELCAANAALAEDLRELHRIADLARAATIQRPLREILGSAADFELTLDAEESTHTPAASQAAKGFQTPERYVIQGEVARGGMGVIYKIRDRELNRTLAMKVMLPEASRETQGASRGSRFVEEVQLTAQLDHPGIVAVHELGADPSGRPYFTMKLVKGRDLASIFELARGEKDGWSLPRAVGALIKACQAVAFAHSKGVIHRDLKPANVMVGRFGEVYVMDWGLAKVLGRPDRHDIRPAADAASLSEIKTPRTHVTPDSADSPLITMDGSVVGTPAYMPPEQAKGQVEEVDAVSDVYSLGAMLYALLTGRGPYTEPDARISPYTILGMVMQGPPKPIAALNPKAPAKLVAICEKAMAREKTNRYQSSLDLAEDLQAWIDHRVVKAYRTGAVAEFKSWVIRNPLTSTATAAAALLLVAGLLVVSFKNNQLEVEKQEATRQRNLAQENLYGSLVREARALRLARRLGYREEVFKLLKQASAMDVPQKQLIDLRNEAVACLGDFVGLNPTIISNYGTNEFGINTTSGVLLDGKGEFAFVGISDGTMRFHELPSGRILQEFKLESRPQGIAANATGDRIVTIHRNWRDESLSNRLNQAMAVRWERSDAGRWSIAEKRSVPGAIQIAQVAGRIQLLIQDPAQRTIQVKDFDSGRELHRFDHEAAGEIMVQAVTSPDGRYFGFEATPYPLATFWDTRTGTKTNITMGWFSAPFTPDSRRIALPNATGVALYQLPEWKVESEFATHVSLGITFSPRGDLLTAPHHGQGRVTLWDWKERRTVVVLEQAPPHAAFSADGRYLGLMSGTNAQIYRLDMSQERLALSGHRGGAPGIEFSPDNKRLASVGKDQMLRLWDGENGHLVWERKLPALGQAVAFSPDGTLLAVVTFEADSITIWEVESGRKLAELGQADAGKRRNEIWSVQFSPNGRLLLASSLIDDKGVLRVWQIEKAETSGDLKLNTALIASHSSDRETGCARFTADGKTVVFLESKWSLDWIEYTAALGIWDFASGKMPSLVKLNRKQGGGINQGLALAADGKRCLVAEGEFVRVLEVPSGTGLSEFSLKASGAIDPAIALSPDETMLAVTTETRLAVEVWDLRTGKVLYRLPELPNTVWWMAWSPDSKRLAISDETVIWNLPGIDRALAEAGLNEP